MQNQTVICGLSVQLCHHVTTKTLNMMFDEIVSQEQVSRKRHPTLPLPVCDEGLLWLRE